MSQPDVQRIIKVGGVGTITVTPDTASVRVGAVITDPSLKAALRQVDQRMNAVIAALKDSGVPAEQMKTIDYRVEVNRNYERPSRPITGYTVSHKLRFSVTPIARVGDLLSLVVETGANSMDNVEFTIADQSEAIRQARSMAMADARSRAQQLADDGNLELGDPLRIVEGEDDEPFERGTYMLMESRSAAPPTIEAGQQSIEMTVSVIYEAHSKSSQV